MSDSHEPSYYEIALTNRQVLTVFVVLLVCVVAAFFSGVWVGRRGTTEVPLAEIAHNDAGPEPDDANLRELRFFADETDPTGGPAEAADAPSLERVAAEPNPDTTLLEDLKGEEPPSGGTAPTGTETARVDPPSPPARGAATEPAPAPVEVARAAPPAAPAETNTAPAPPPAAPATGEGDLVVQVFFSSDEQRARDLVARLGGSGYPAYLSPVPVGEQVMYRVRLGPYAERPDAESAADRVRRAFKLDTWITQ